MTGESLGLGSNMSSPRTSPYPPAGGGIDLPGLDGGTESVARAFERLQVRYGIINVSHNYLLSQKKLFFDNQIVFKNEILKPCQKIQTG